MPEIIALIAPQNVMPTLAETLPVLGAHDSQLAIVHCSGDETKIQRLSLEAPVQKITFKEASRWLMAAFSNSGAIVPFLYQGKLSICALGACNNHQQLAQEYQLSPGCSLSNLIGAMLAQQGDVALSDAITAISGKFAGDIAFICQNHQQPQHVYAVNLGIPLYLGLEPGLRQICSSSAQLIRQRANPVHEITRGEIVRFGLSSPVLCHPQADPSPLSMAPNSGLHVPHHMLEEIQNQALTLPAQVDKYFAGTVFPAPLLAKLSALQSITLLASGSSFHAAMIASYWFESLAGLKTQVELASEYRFRDIHPHHQELIIAISQSGETADTVEAIRHAQQKGSPHSLALCNTPASTLTTITDFCILTNIGEELSVSSTKSFTAQLLLLFQLALTIGKSNKLTPANRLASAEEEMRRLGACIQSTLEQTKALRRWAGEIHTQTNLFVIGRHAMYPVALEGAFKFKEVAYQYALGYAAGELKHGPIALIDENLPVIACLPWNEHAERMLSNLHDIRSNRGNLYVLSDGNLASSERFNVIHMPGGLKELAPICYIVALQLLAYYSAMLRGNVIDTPRNLAKTQVLS
ncbi:SIS domain-containing protein [Chitinibacter sp. S2-10]|uniref:SIS domain-containing protein n=1 Tax=Chitinibacter sp. S2-10 TaxID=3373597 RepID=UPI003977A952